MGQTAHCPSHALQVALTLCALMLCLDVFADSCKHRKAHPLSKSLHYLVKSFRSGNGLPAPSTADSALEYEIVPIHTSIGNSTRPHRDIRDTPSHPHAVDDNPHHSSRFSFSTPSTFTATMSHSSDDQLGQGCGGFRSRPPRRSPCAECRSS